MNLFGDSSLFGGLLGGVANLTTNQAMSYAEMVQNYNNYLNQRSIKICDPYAGGAQAFRHRLVSGTIFGEPAKQPPPPPTNLDWLIGRVNEMRVKLG